MTNSGALSRIQLSVDVGDRQTDRRTDRHRHRVAFPLCRAGVHLLLPYLDWIGLCSVLRPRQHSIGYTGDGFYRSKDPTNSIKVLKEEATKDKANNENN